MAALATSLQSMGQSLSLIGGPASNELRIFMQESPCWEAELRPTAQAQSRARLVASILDVVAPAFPPHLSPGVGGGLQFELRHAGVLAGRELDIEVSSDGSLGYLVADGPRSDSQDLDQEFLHVQIERLARWFAAQA